jgi:clan AA aspartic protease (TIGR02281 family)
MKKRINSLTRAIWSLCGLSAVTSGAGLWWVYSQNTEILALSIGLAAVTTVALQRLIVLLWDTGLSERMGRKGWIAIALGLKLSLASAGLAAGSYVFLFSGSALEVYGTQQSSNTLLEPVSKFGVAMRDIATQMDAISADASVEAEVEATRGGTCVGDKPTKKCGPKCRLRKRHSTEAEHYSGLMRAAADEAVSIASELQADQSREGMLAAFRQAHALASHKNLTLTKSWLQAEHDGFQGEFLDAETSKNFVCRDPEFAEKLKGALDALSAGFNLPSLPPEPASFTFKDAIGKSYSDGFKLVWSLVRGEDPAQDDATMAYTVAGYIPAAIVELLLIVLVYFRSLAIYDRGGNWTREDEFIAASREIPEDLRSSYRRWTNLITELMLEERDGWYFARPTDGNPEINRLALEAVIILGLPNDPDLLPDVDLGALYPEWVESRNAVHGGARRFAVHPLTSAFVEWHRRAVRDLSADNGNPVEAPPSSEPFDDSQSEQTYNGEHVVTLRADDRGYFWANAKINGKPVRTLVDTGATRVSLTFEDAERLGLDPDSLSFDVPTQTAGGKTKTASVKIARVEVGGIRVKDIDASVSLKGDNNSSLLGMTFLNQVRFDVYDGQLTLRQ